MAVISVTRAVIQVLEWLGSMVLDCSILMQGALWRAVVETIVDDQP